MDATSTVKHPFLTGARHAEWRGSVLSHLIGFAFFFQVVFGRIITFEFQMNRLIDIPIRLLAVWLIMDRIGRRGRVQVSIWDWTQLGFIACYAMALVYADATMQREIGLQNFMQQTLSFLQPYFFFVVVREGTLRRGFRPYVVITWILATVAITCFVALAQGTNILGLRDNIDLLVKQRQAEARLEGPSAMWQARGLFVHANAQAIFLIMGIATLVGAAYYRRPGPFEIACGALYGLTIFATFSRTGILSLAIMALAVVGLLILRRNFRAAIVALTAIGILGFTFVTVVIAFDVERFKPFIEGLGPVRNDPTKGTLGLTLRQRNFQKAVELAQKFPVTGVQPMTTALNQQMVIRESVYTFEGLVLNSFAYGFVQYGVYGLAYIVGILYVGFSQFKRMTIGRPFAAGAVMAAVGLVVTSMTENTVFDAMHMTIVNIIVALAVSRLPVDEKRLSKHKTGWWDRMLGYPGPIKAKPIA